MELEQLLAFLKEIGMATNEVTTFEGALKLMKSNKKLLKAKDKAEELKEDAAAEVEGEEVVTEPEAEAPKKEEPKAEELKEEEKVTTPATPPVTKVEKKAEEEKLPKSKFVTMN